MSQRMKRDLVSPPAGINRVLNPLSTLTVICFIQLHVSCLLISFLLILAFQLVVNPTKQNIENLNRNTKETCNVATLQSGFSPFIQVRAASEEKNLLTEITGSLT